MKYMLAIYEDEANYPDGEQGEAWRDILSKHTAFGGELAQSGVQFNGAGLRHSTAATTIRTGADGAKSVHDGPFAETREQLGGFYVVDAPDLDAALAIARKIPLARHGAVEVRPVLGMD